MDLSTVFLVIAIIFIHFVADFVVQTSWQATNKSKNNLALTMHVLSYSLIWFLVASIYGMITNNFMIAFLFPMITFACHWITDYFTSRLNSYLWNKSDIHNFFVSVGFDQVLHYIQLFLTFSILNNLHGQ